MEDFKEILEKAEQGDKASMSQVAWHLIRNHATPNYEAEAFKWLIKYENGNKIEAMKLLATFTVALLKLTLINSIRQSNGIQKLLNSATQRQ